MFTLISRISPVKAKSLLETIFFIIIFTCPGLLQAGGGGGGHVPLLPVFGRTVDPISTREADYALQSTKFPPGFSDLVIALLPEVDI